MHRGFIIYDDLWHGTLLLKESASKLTFYAFYRRCNLLSCYLLLPGGRYSTVIRGLIAIFRKCIISLYFGIEGGIPHFRQRCYPGTVLKAGGYIFNRPAILKNITGYSSNMGLDKILGIAEKVELNFTAEEHPLNVLAGIEFRAV